MSFELGGGGFQINRDLYIDDNSTVLRIPVADSTTASQGKGNLIYDTNTETVLVSDGINWNPIGVPPLGGDVIGRIQSNEIRSLQGVPLSYPILPVPGDLLKFNGTFWTNEPEIFPSRTLFVYKNAPGLFPNYPTLGDAITAAVGISPTFSSWVRIEISPGTYPEITPLYVPPFISITGLTSSQSDVIIIPKSPANPGAILQSKGNVRVSGIVLNGSDGSGGYSSIGFNSYHDLFFQGSSDFLSCVTIRNCQQSAFSVNGNLTTSTQYSRVLICKNCSAQVTTISFTMDTAFNCSKGGVLHGNDLSVSGFLSGGTNNVTYGYKIDDDFSFMDLSIIQSSGVVNAISVGGNVTSRSRGHYPVFRVKGATLGLFSGCGILVKSKSVVSISDFKIQDNTGTFPGQKHAIFTNSPLGSDPNYFSSMNLNARYDLIVLSFSDVQTEFAGSILNENVPGSSSNVFFSDAEVGTSVRPSSFNAGEGTPNAHGIKVLSQNGGIYTDITANVTSQSPESPVVVSCATVSQIDILSAPATIDGIALLPGVSLVLVKDGSISNPNSPEGYSLDNGIYIWNGEGNPMTRYSSFDNGVEYTDKTWFIIESGNANCGSQWKLNGLKTENITFGTSLLNFSSNSSVAFQNSDGNALYIGNTNLKKFPHLQLTLSSILKTTPSFPSTSVISWEYWDGSSWSSLPFMTVNDAAPYKNYGKSSFGYGGTISPGEKLSYSMHFGPISDTWSSLSVDGISGYWVRARVIGEANIIQTPVLDSIRLGTSHTKISKDGFVVYYGNARPITYENIPLTQLYGTGISGEVAPLSARQICSASPVISINTPNSYWGPGVDTTACFTWHAPNNIDSSTPLKFSISFSHQASTGTQNLIWQVDYAFVNDVDGVISINSGLGTFPTRSSGSFPMLISSTFGNVQSAEISLDMTGLVPSSTVVWFKLSRKGTNPSDTYTGVAYISLIRLFYSIWSPGKSYFLH